MPEREIDVYVIDPPPYEGVLNDSLDLYRRFHIPNTDITVTASKSIINERPHVFTLTISSPTLSQNALYNAMERLCDYLVYGGVIEKVYFTPGGRRRRTHRSKSRRSKSRRSKSHRSRH